MARKKSNASEFNKTVTKEEFKRVGKPLEITVESMARWLGYEDESGFRKSFIETREQINGKTESVYRLDKPSSVLFRLLVARPELRALLNGGRPIQVGKSDPELRTLLALIDLNVRNPDDWRDLKHTVTDFKEKPFIEMLIEEDLIERQTSGRSLRSGQGSGEWFTVTDHARKRLFSAAVVAAFAVLSKGKPKRFTDPVAVRSFLVDIDGKRVEDD